MVELLVGLTELVESLGYLGIFIMTFVESTFVPIPSEVTLVPAGYLVADGRMSLIFVLLSSTLGTIGGASFNYAIARFYGRSMLIKYGKYFFMNPERLASMEGFFERHGSISTLIGRMLPGVKHFISFPAGVAKMNVSKFFIYTGIGGFCWNSIVIALGYYIGQEQKLLKKYIHHINLGLILILCLISFIYIKRYKDSKAKQ